MQPTRFDDLLRQHLGLIHKVAHAYCRNAADRDDVVQEIFVQLWRARGRFDGRYRPSTWIYRIALNVAISFYRRERRHGEGRESIEVDLASVTDDQPVESGEDVRLLHRSIDGLGALDRALVLLYLDGNDHATIADVLGLTVSNVGTKLGRIKKRLRDTFERRAGKDRTETTDATR